MIFSNFDKDKNGSLTLDEFGNLVKVINARVSQNDIQELFKIFDTNKDQKISTAEFNTILADAVHQH